MDFSKQEGGGRRRRSKRRRRGGGGAAHLQLQLLRLEVVVQPGQLPQEKLVELKHPHLKHEVNKEVFVLLEYSTDQPETKAFEHVDM